MLQHIFQPDLLGCWIVCLCTVPYNCGVCSLFSQCVWSFPWCRPFTPPQPVASLTAPRHLVPHAPSWTPNYRPRPMLMIDFERFLAYSLSLPQCKFAKAAKGVYTRIQLYSADLRYDCCIYLYNFHRFNSENGLKVV